MWRTHTPTHTLGRSRVVGATETVGRVARWGWEGGQGPSHRHQGDDKCRKGTAALGPLLGALAHPSHPHLLFALGQRLQDFPEEQHPLNTLRESFTHLFNQ